MSAAKDLGRVSDALREALKREAEGSAAAADEAERILREQATKGR